MIELDNLTLAHGSAAPLLRNQSCVIPSGSLTALTGCNGSGKSTLLRTIAGMQKPHTGRVLIGPDRVDVASASVHALARQVAVVGTGRTDVRHLSCRQLVELGRSPHTGLFGSLSEADHRAVTAALEAVELSAFADRQVRTLSDGEHQRLMIARAIAQQTPIILLDEPTGFLDVPNRRAVTSLLATLAHEQDKTILFSTHEIQLALSSADFVLHLSPPELTFLPPSQIVDVPAFSPLHTE